MSDLSYYNPIITSYGGVLSCDKIRIHAKRTISYLDFERYLNANIIFFDVKQYRKYNNLSYGLMQVISCDDVSVVIGSDWRDIKDIITDNVFIEFNPNKVLNHTLLSSLFDFWISSVRDVVLKRFDLALDLHLPRSQLCLIKSGKMPYTFIKSSSITEYIGTRSSPYRIKLYDKGVEADLNIDLSRFELTLMSFPCLNDINEYLSNLLCFNSLSIVNNNDMILLQLLYDSDDWGKYLNQFKRAKRKKLISYLSKLDFSLNLDEYTLFKGILYNILKK